MESAFLSSGDSSRFGEQLRGLRTPLLPRVLGHCSLAASPLSGVLGSQSVSCPGSFPEKGDGEKGAEEGQREETAGSLPQIRPGWDRGAGVAEPHQAAPHPTPRPARWPSGELEGWQEDCCFICPLFITCLVPERNSCVR